MLFHFVVATCFEKKQPRCCVLNQDAENDHLDSLVARMWVAGGSRYWPSAKKTPMSAASSMKVQALKQLDTRSHHWHDPQGGSLRRFQAYPCQGAVDHIRTSQAIDPTARPVAIRLKNWYSAMRLLIAEETAYPTYPHLGAFGTWCIRWSRHFWT